LSEASFPIKIGKLTQAIIVTLGLEMEPGQEILLGESNILHMQTRHPGDFACYGSFIPDILASPDYVGLNPKDTSIEYVKEFWEQDEYVKVAVRVSLSGCLFVRSLYVLNKHKVKIFIRNGTLKKPLTKPPE